MQSHRLMCELEMAKEDILGLDSPKNIRVEWHHDHGPNFLCKF